jgi:hypothetical protein
MELGSDSKAVKLPTSDGDKAKFKAWFMQMQAYANMHGSRQHSLRSPCFQKEKTMGWMNLVEKESWESWLKGGMPQLWHVSQM